MVNNNLKEYYIKLQGLYKNAVNILTAINQTLSSNASEVSVELFENNTSTTVKIPSFLYLDNKVEQLQNAFENLFNMPQSGEAWFSNDGGMYKLQMVRSNTAPLSPDINTNKLTAGFSNNTFIKDLVNPRTYLRLDIDNLPFNINQMYMKKIVFLNTAIFTELQKLNVVTYEDYVAALFNYRKGIDFEEYETVLDLPIKEDKYVSEFKIDAVIDSDRMSDSENNIVYTVKLDTLEYHALNDSSETYYLKPSDYLCIGNELCIYKILDVDYTLMNISFVESVGHIPLQAYSENSEMILQKYNFDYSDFIKDINWSLELDIKDLRNDYCNEDLISIKRHITYNFDIKNIKKRIKKQIKSQKDPLYHFVSFENEFIFSIYDDRGCDIVFFSEEKYKEFYYKLEKYFLDYDRDVMKNTLKLIN